MLVVTLTFPAGFLSKLNSLANKSSELAVKNYKYLCRVC